MKKTNKTPQQLLTEEIAISFKYSMEDSEVYGQYLRNTCLDMYNNAFRSAKA